MNGVDLAIFPKNHVRHIISLMLYSISFISTIDNKSPRMIIYHHNNDDEFVISRGTIKTVGQLRPWHDKDRGTIKTINIINSPNMNHFKDREIDLKF